MPRLSARRHPIDPRLVVITQTPGNVMTVDIRAARTLHRELGEILDEHDAPAPTAER